VRTSARCSRGGPAGSADQGHDRKERDQQHRAGQEDADQGCDDSERQPNGESGELEWEQDQAENQPEHQADDQQGNDD
jgi:hypothetical protein